MTTGGRGDGRAPSGSSILVYTLDERITDCSRTLNGRSLQRASSKIPSKRFADILRHRPSVVGSVVHKAEQLCVGSPVGASANPR